MSDQNLNPEKLRPGNSKRLFDIVKHTLKKNERDQEDLDRAVRSRLNDVYQMAWWAAEKGECEVGIKLVEDPAVNERCAEFLRAEGYEIILNNKGLYLSWEHRVDPMKVDKTESPKDSITIKLHSKP
jgi:hypothetical protein